MEATVQADELPLFPQEEWYEQLLRYGLYLGAAFQILCILAVIFDVSPKSKSGDGLDEDSCSSSEDEESEDEAYQQHKRNRRRLERKKRR